MLNIYHSYKYETQYKVPNKTIYTYANGTVTVNMGVITDKINKLSCITKNI